jgi:hypothetical protein
MSSPDTSLQSTPALPIACTLSAEDQRQRTEEITALFEHVTAVRETPMGYAFAFPAGTDWAHALLDYIVEELACCPFITFELTFSMPHDRIWLTLSGGDNIKELIGDMFPHIVGRPMGTGADASADDASVES